MLVHAKARCPRCTGNLYLERDSDGRRTLPPEWVCLQCGWRQAISRQSPAARTR